MFCCFVVTHVSRELNHSNISQDSHRKRSQIARVHASTRKRSRQGLLPIPFTHGFTEKINHHEIKYSIRLSIKHEIIPYLNQTEIKYQTWDIHHQKSNPWDYFSGTFFGGNHDFPYHYGLCPVNFPLPIDWVTWVLSPVEKGGTGDWAVFSRPWTTKQSQKSWKGLEQIPGVLHSTPSIAAFKKGNFRNWRQLQHFFLPIPLCLQYLQLQYLPSICFLPCHSRWKAASTSSSWSLGSGRLGDPVQLSMEAKASNQWKALNPTSNKNRPKIDQK